MFHRPYSRPPCVDGGLSWLWRRSGMLQVISFCNNNRHRHRNRNNSAATTKNKDPYLRYLLPALSLLAVFVNVCLTHRFALFVCLIKISCFYFLFYILSLPSAQDTHFIWKIRQWRRHSFELLVRAANLTEFSGERDWQLTAVWHLPWRAYNANAVAQDADWHTVVVVVAGRNQ